MIAIICYFPSFIYSFVTANTTAIMFLADFISIPYLVLVTCSIRLISTILKYTHYYHTCIDYSSIIIILIISLTSIISDVVAITR